MYLVPYNPQKIIFLMIYSHFFFLKLARLCVTWDSGRISAKTTNPVTRDSQIDWNGTVYMKVYVTTLNPDRQHEKKVNIEIARKYKENQ